jgi:hypothetical protein
VVLMMHRQLPDRRFLYLRFPDLRTFSVAFGLLILVAAPASVLAQPAPSAVAAFNSYISGVESRLAQQHRSQDTFLSPSALTPQNETRLRQGEFIVEQITPSAGEALPGAMLHHWRGTAFVAGATAADFAQLMKNFNAYPQHFSPQVLQARVISQHDDRLEAVMRVRQKHIISVVMDTNYDIAFGRLDPQHQYSLSRSTQISEIDSPGTPNERALSSSEEHGFLWRQNTYWSYEERDGGLYMQIESVSLSRSIPSGLGWVVRPFVQSVPRESLEFTLRSTCNALRT